jgi:hypothetical protein
MIFSLQKYAITRVNTLPPARAHTHASLERSFLLGINIFRWNLPNMLSKPYESNIVM